MWFKDEGHNANAVHTGSQILQDLFKDFEKVSFKWLNKKCIYIHYI